jgi:hypothetical protein
MRTYAETDRVDLERQYKEKQMGRPVNSRNFGATGTDAAPTIPCRFYDGSSSVEGYIVAQKGTNKFKVYDGSTYVTGFLVDEIAPNGANEISIVGLINGSDPITIKKMTNRIATDWNGTRYKWEAQDDSSESLLILTPF